MNFDSEFMPYYKVTHTLFIKIIKYMETVIFFIIRVKRKCGR